MAPSAGALLGSGLIAGSILSVIVVPVGVARSATPTADLESSIERLVVDAHGGEPDGDSSDVAASADGRYVAFVSTAADLGPADGNGVADVYRLDRVAARVERLSVGIDGGDGDGPSYAPSISADGRYVAFMSAASNLVPDDGNGLADVFVRDVAAGVTSRASVASGGVELRGSSWHPVVSPSGTHVAFSSNARELWEVEPSCDPGQWRCGADGYVHELATGITAPAVLTPPGSRANGPSTVDGFSAEGRYLVVSSLASDLVGGDRTGGCHASGVAGGELCLSDVFRRDRLTGVNERVSLDALGADPNGASSGASISADGRFVAFTSYASDLVADDHAGRCLLEDGEDVRCLGRDVFVRDVVAGRTTRVSVDRDGGEPDAPATGGATAVGISADGRVVGFVSDATDVVAGECQSACSQLYVRDITGGVTRRLTDAAGASGSAADGDVVAAALSADGTFAVFTSAAANLVAGDTNALADVFGTAVHPAGPTVTFVEPRDGAVYRKGTAVTVRYRCTGPDGTAATACRSTIPAGRALPTGTIGEHTLGVRAVDRWGGAVERAATYLVAPTGAWLAVGDASVVEPDVGTAVARIPLNLSRAITTGLAVTYEVRPATADGTDAVLRTGRLTIPAGATGGWVEVAVRADTTPERLEQLVVAVTQASVPVVRPHGHVQVVDDDAVAPITVGGPGAVSIGDVTVLEGNAGRRTARLAVQLRQPAAQAVTIAYATLPGTATATDYVTRAGVVTIASGRQQATIDIPVRVDTVAEGDEQFQVLLSNPTGASLLRSTATVTVRNDDAG